MSAPHSPRGLRHGEAQVRPPRPHPARVPAPRARGGRRPEGEAPGGRGGGPGMTAMCRSNPGAPHATALTGSPGPAPARAPGTRPVRGPGDQEAPWEERTHASALGALALASAVLGTNSQGLLGVAKAGLAWRKPGSPSRTS